VQQALFVSVRGFLFGEDSVGLGHDDQSVKLESSRQFIYSDYARAPFRRGVEVVFEPFERGVEQLRMVRFIGAEFGEAGQW
jgi:hypothetical protein